MSPSISPQHQAKWFAESKVALLTTVCGVLTMLGIASLVVAASIHYAVLAINSDAKRRQTEVVLASLNEMSNDIGARLKAMSVSDELYAKSRSNIDEGWLRRYFRQRVLNATNYHMLAVLDQDGRLMFDTMPNGEHAPGMSDQLGAVMMDGARSIMALNSGYNAAAEPRRFHSSFHYRLWKGVPSIVTVNTIQPETASPDLDKTTSHLAAVHRMDGEFLNKLRRITGISTLVWSSQIAVAPGSASVDIAGSGIGALAWVPDLPGDVIIARAKPGLYLALGLLLLVAAAVIAMSAFTIRRLTLQKALAEYLASTDQLTGLANRRTFNARIDELMSSQAEMARGFAMMMIDLDRFKPLNDTHGHDAGDFALQEIGNRLNALADDGIVAARLGGDEFAVLAPAMVGQHASLLAARIIADLSAPIRLRCGTLASIGASVGIAEVPTDATSARDLCLKADAALYRAKALGRGTAVSAGDLDMRVAGDQLAGTPGGFRRRMSMSA